MKRTMPPSFLLLCAALFVAACGTAVKGTKVSAAGLRAAPERLEIDGRTYSLSASAWRDFMPIAPPGGQPLTVFVKVTAEDMMPMPPELGIDHLWALKGDEQWDATAQVAKEDQAGPRREATISGGPKWDVGSTIDVVARLTKGKQAGLVRAARVTVKRTD